MSDTTNRVPTRRTFLKGAGGMAAASALAGVAIPQVHAGESNTIRLALVGCGGRGTGAAGDALSSRAGPDGKYPLPQAGKSSRREYTDVASKA